MSELNLNVELSADTKSSATDRTKLTEKPLWESPQIEDVSEQVMAQPYIRFT